MSKSFEEKMRDKLKIYEVQPPDSVWKGVQKGAAKPGIFPGNRFLSIVLAVTALAGALFLWSLLNEDSASPNEALIVDETNKTPVDTVPPVFNRRGKAVFDNYCRTCHDPGLINDLTGPALFGVTRRRPMDWLYRFTRNPAQMIREGDSIAVRVWDEWKPSLMNAFPNLTDQELEDLYNYIEQRSEYISQHYPDLHQLPEQAELQGQMLYQRLCSSCHSVLTQESNAPPLFGITRRRTSSYLLNYRHPARYSRGDTLNLDEILQSDGQLFFPPEAGAIPERMLRSIYEFLEGETDRYRLDLKSRVEAGMQVYEQLCGSCHIPGYLSDQERPGPDLRSVHRRHSRQWLMDFTRNSRQMPAVADSLPPRERVQGRPVYEHRFEYDFQLEMIYDYLEWLEE